MNQTKQIKIDFIHVNPKVSDAFAFLANAMGITVQITPIELPEVAKSDEKVEEVK